MSFHRFLATLFVLVNLIGQLGGSVLVIARKYVEVACGILLGIILLQVSWYIIYIYIIVHCI